MPLHPDSVFSIMRHNGGLGAAGSDPSVFPVALVEALLTAFSDPGDLIYEPFCGFGTQIVAAERAGRCCFTMELDPTYCDVAVRRWEIATGMAVSRNSPFGSNLRMFVQKDKWNPVCRLQ